MTQNQLRFFSHEEMKSGSRILSNRTFLVPLFLPNNQKKTIVEAYIYKVGTGTGSTDLGEVFCEINIIRVGASRGRERVEVEDGLRKMRVENSSNQNHIARWHANPHRETTKRKSPRLCRDMGKYRQVKRGELISISQSEDEVLHVRPHKHP